MCDAIWLPPLTFVLWRWVTNFRGSVLLLTSNSHSGCGNDWAATIDVSCQPVPLEEFEKNSRWRATRDIWMWNKTVVGSTLANTLHGSISNPYTKLPLQIHSRKNILANKNCLNDKRNHFAAINVFLYLTKKFCSFHLIVLVTHNLQSVACSFHTVYCSDRLPGLSKRRMIGRKHKTRHEKHC